jgi:hypothetical protein
MVHDRSFRTLYAGKASGVTVTLIERPLAHHQSAAAELVRRGYKVSLSDEEYTAIMMVRDAAAGCGIQTICGAVALM